ncbi:competence damage-inducible protein A [Candidatus Bathyarchaeota archaeon]|nr:competence damage-inducible protein A [Candidatus Bathyarchaeota archaeon]
MKHFVEIISIGNELLIGKTLNTNAHWLAKKITRFGLIINRIVTVGDTINQISCSLRNSIDQRPSFILTTGGLGPTFDDKTLEGIAKVMGSKTVVNKKALKMVKEKYLTYSIEKGIEKIDLTSYRIKMAMLPEGATPLPNPVGTAPGVYVEYENVVIIALPGVPSEMKKIFSDSVSPLFRKLESDSAFFEKSIHSTDVMESEIAPVIEKVMKNNPFIYIKSHPKGTESGSNIEYHLSTTINNAFIASNNLNKAVYQLTELVKEKGGKIFPQKSEIREPKKGK